MSQMEEKGRDESPRKQGIFSLLQVVVFQKFEKAKNTSHIF